jgi:GT2 family glycosyltransferase
LGPASPVSIIIPHYEGDIILSCLHALEKNTGAVPVEIVVIDDSIGPDGSLDRARVLYPSIKVLKTGGRRGFGAACNMGLKGTGCKYAVLLNNDAEVQAGWLAPLVDAMESDPQVGFCQPKFLSLRDPARFDEGGGAGGMLDRYGYPFALGSLVRTIETDRGQYDAPREIGRTHGAAMMIRLSVLREIGFFDEDFYMMAEDADLCCRALMSGFKIRSVPSSVVFHYSGWTLKRESVRRYYLSHRNTIVMVLKNWPLSWLAWIFPARLFFELSTVLYDLAWDRNWAQPAGILMALGWIFTHPFNIARRRRECQGVRTGRRSLLLDHIYRHSIIRAYFIRGIKTAAQLLGGQSPPSDELAGD